MEVIDFDGDVFESDLRLGGWVDASDGDMFS